MFVPSELHWRWKLLLSPGSPLCHIIPETNGELPGSGFHCVMGFKKGFVLEPVSFFGKTEQWQTFDVIQSNSLKQSLWQFIPLKLQAMFPFMLKKDYHLWHLSCNSYGRACLFTSRASNRGAFKKWCTLIWQSQTFFKSGTGVGTVSFTFLQTCKDLNLRFVRVRFLVYHKETSGWLVWCCSSLRAFNIQMGAITKVCQAMPLYT